MKAFTFGGKKPKAPCSIKAASSADAEDAVQTFGADDDDKTADAQVSTGFGLITELGSAKPRNPTRKRAIEEMIGKPPDAKDVLAACGSVESRIAAAALMVKQKSSAIALDIGDGVSSEMSGGSEVKKTNEAHHTRNDVNVLVMTLSSGQ